MKHPRIRKPRRGVLERPAPTTFSSLPALASYPRNTRELSRLFLFSRVLFIGPPLAGNVRASVAPLSLKARRRETHSGKAPRSTPPTIGLLSRYFLPTRRTTPASSRRWSWGPYMAPRPGGKSSLPRRRRRRRPGKSFPTCRAGCFLFLLFLSVSRDRRPFFRVPPIPGFVFLRPASVSELSRTINDGTLRNYSRHRNDSQKGSTPSRK